jgi:P-type Ca2+ transporter type 2C
MAQGPGLTEADAAARLAAEGFNELPRQDRRTPLRIVLEVLREPMLALLLGAGLVYLLIGDLAEALILLAFASLSVLITVVQEARTERVLEALRDLTSPRALVIRGGVQKRIAGREVVRGDLIVLAEGDRVPADATLVSASDLKTDESLLTGESVAVRKIAGHREGSVAPPRPGGDDLPFVFSGSLVVRGTGVAEVTATGALSEIGRIGQSLAALDAEPPRLKSETRRFVRIFAIVGAGVSLLAVLLYGLLRGGWLDAALAGIALGMSMLPEEFPVVLTIFMAMGAWRISQARVLTRRAAAIETLGSATVLCTDKTGTLTENRMRIAALCDAGGETLRPQEAGTAAIPPTFADLVRFGMLASARDPFDPMEKAFHELAAALPDRGAAANWELVHAYGLRPDLLAMSQLWQAAAGDGRQVVAAKGAPEAIVELCRLAGSEAAEISRRAGEMASQGLRVLAVARATHHGHRFPDSQRQIAYEFLGLAGLADPLRASVPAAVAECRSAGIRVVMITGDYPATAQAVARQAGLDHARILSGRDLEAMGDDALVARLRDVPVFARIMPEQKLRIVQALKAGGDIVAMTGDGVNDAPSLKAAHIGIAMGERGTDVAREASAIVLLNDDFGSIVQAVRLGRRIYDNLRKAIGFIFAIHIPIAGLALLPLAFGLPIILGPLHIAFLEMIIDPVCTLVFEAEKEEDDVMRRPPRGPAEPLFSRQIVVWSVLQGTVALAAVAGLFVAGHYRGLAEGDLRVLTFVSLVLVIVSLIFVNRSFSASLRAAFTRPNRALALILPAVAAMIAAVAYLPVARRFLHFGTLHGHDLAVAAGAALLVLLVLEAAKRPFAGPAKS